MAPPGEALMAPDSTSSSLRLNLEGGGASWGSGVTVAPAAVEVGGLS